MKILSYTMKNSKAQGMKMLTSQTNHTLNDVTFTILCIVDCGCVKTMKLSNNGVQVNEDGIVLSSEEYENYIYIK